MTQVVALAVAKTQVVAVVALAVAKTQVVVVVVVKGQETNTHQMITKEEEVLDADVERTKGQYESIATAKGTEGLGLVASKGPRSLPVRPKVLGNFLNFLKNSREFLEFSRISRKIFSWHNV